MKILLLDIETAPNRVYVWGLFKQNVALNQIEEPGFTMCWSAKWLGEQEVHFRSIHKHGKKKMLKGIYDLLEEADVVIHYNGSNFDIPTLNQEFLEAGYPPPAPALEIDLLKTCRGRFRFLSNKLDFVTKMLVGEGKVRHKGMDLWRECLAGDDGAWATMEKYNKRDVTILEKLYKKLLPWIQPHPNHALFKKGDEIVCPNCGSPELQRRGTYYTQTMTYQRFRCMDCGKWSKARTNNVPKEKRKAILAGVK